MTLIYKARVPTNIAFLKYWGKSDATQQWPANDSLSMTLDLYSETLASREPLPAQAGAYAFSSDQALTASEAFLHKGLRHLQWLAAQLDFSERIYLHTRNEFPASCGIASSARGLGSLTLAALACWTQSSSLSQLASCGFTRERIAQLARAGSGSACRSFWGGFVHWQRGETAQTQSVLPLASQDHWDLRDTIVIVSTQEKLISSSQGHRLAPTSVQFVPRLARLPARLAEFQTAILQKNIRQLGQLLEEEALEMHAVMASSQPPCVYMSEATQTFLQFLQEIRVQKALPIYFTLDAGPNVHLIYEARHQEAVASLLKTYQTIDVGISSGPSLGTETAQDGHH